VIDNRDMIHVSVEEMKSDVAKYLRRVEEGETLILVQSNRPVAEVRPITSPLAQGRRPFGLCAGEFTVPDDFDAPLPEEIVAGFEGR